MTRTPIETARLEIRLPVPDDAAGLQAFSSGDEDLDDFLRADALRLDERNVVRTFLALYDGELTGYVSLMADAIVLQTKERKRLWLSAIDHPSVPAVKIARLAVGEHFRERHRGLGELLVRFAAHTRPRPAITPPRKLSIRAARSVCSSRTRLAGRVGRRCR